ncbi:NADH-quinone oxidoreductase subunit H [Ereboglobus sp. PH5-5]|uniref:complex I subunit 1/NuoH family protein n=1 Tax=Ereboglobus sp. PH5-5 TaxID=2940529 RepID=UPI0024070AAF|nr:complex I subunit 1 family protein [Ereboglobus sp. PH5-5]MDF9833292.1 NADH-quinone oxidoreductase subunit H [Ereboglobus sp. PH5-5]
MIDFYFSLPDIVRYLIQGIAVICFLFPVGAACSMAERKVAAWAQDRPGPNRARPWLLARIPIIGPILGYFGIFNLMADGGKLLFREDIIPGHVNKFYFVMAPIVAMTPALSTIVFVPFGAYLDSAGQILPVMLANVDIGILGVFALASLSVYSLILAGWASNSKYPFLGAIRASAQLISYELSMTLAVVPVLLWINAPGTTGSLSLVRVVEFQSQPGFWGGMWFVFIMPVSAFIFLITIFAETNRQPFDMPESEADLVGGYHTEYGSYKWSLFFVAEYCQMIVGSGIFVLLFLGGWNPLPWIPLADLVNWLHDLLHWQWLLHPIFVGLLSIGIFVTKVLIFIFIFMWVRWTLPRFRYDQVMRIGWQRLLPLSIANLVVYIIAIALLQK